MTGLQHEVVGAAALAGAFLALLAAAELWWRRGARPETTRKLVHVCGGLICLAFPWAVASAYTVLALAAALSLLIGAGARLGFLRSLHGVSRKTRGSEYYPLAIFLVYVMAGPATWLYVCSVLVLTVADACAALIGVSYGRIRFRVEEDCKSLEGSLAFAAIAFLSMALPMLFMANLPWPVCALAALLVAMLVTGFEAISLRGTDNLFVPVGVFFILAKITTRPLPEILYQNVSLLALCTVMGVIAWRSRGFSLTGALVLILATYGTWSLGSEIWALPVLLAFVAYVGIWRRLAYPAGVVQGIRVAAVFAVVSYPLLILVLANMLHMADWLYAPFVMTVVSSLAFSAWNHLLWGDKGDAPTGRGAAALVGLASTAAVAVIPWAILPETTGRELAALAAVAACVTAADRALTGPSREFQPARIWPGHRLLLTVAAACVILALQWFGLLKVWSPR